MHRSELIANASFWRAAPGADAQHDQEQQAQQWPAWVQELEKAAPSKQASYGAPAQGLELGE